MTFKTLIRTMCCIAAAILSFMCLRETVQRDATFIIKDTLINREALTRMMHQFDRADTPFFEDDEFVVSRTCNGEWGGSIKFKDKVTGIEYGCQATCPVIINKLGGKYIVTNTLHHLMGSSTILEIKNPRLLQKVTFDEAPEQRKKRFKYVGENEVKSETGAVRLIDTVGVTTLISFPYNGELFHVISEQKTYLARIVNNRFDTIQMISGESLWAYDSKLLRIDDEHHMVYFGTYEIAGILDINRSEITVLKFK